MCQSSAIQQTALTPAAINRLIETRRGSWHRYKSAMVKERKTMIGMAIDGRRHQPLTVANLNNTP
jgi:hypothetical protein